MSGTVEPLLSENDLSEMLGRAVHTLQKDRLRGFGPPYIKMGRHVRYSPAAVQTWLAGQVRRSTTDTGTD